MTSKKKSDLVFLLHYVRQREATGGGGGGGDGGGGVCLGAECFLTEVTLFCFFPASQHSLCTR